MDPVTHTLVGAALARSGLERRTGLATATLLIGANLPDVDVVSYAWGSTTALGFRRGLTHGVLGVAVLPLLLTGAIVLWDRWFRRRRAAGGRPVVPRQVLLLAAIAVATHPLLDFLNTYGVRWLAPFSWRWFYGDVLFIVDPWVWALLAAGVWAGRRGPRGPRIALAATVAYTMMMAASNLAARQVAERSLARTGDRALRIMAAPLAVTPLGRWVVVETEAGYRAGMLEWLAPEKLELEPLPLDREAPKPIADAIRGDPGARRFLGWARFPYYVVDERDDGRVVYIGDARYTLDPEGSWAAIRVELPRAGP